MCFRERKVTGQGLTFKNNSVKLKKIENFNSMRE